MNDTISLTLAKIEEITKSSFPKRVSTNTRFATGFQTKENSLKSINTTIIEEDSQINKSCSSLKKENEDEDDEPLPNIQVLNIKPIEKNLDICKENVKLLKEEQEFFENSVSICKENIDPNVISEAQERIRDLNDKKISEKNEDCLNFEEKTKKTKKIKKDDLIKLILQLNEV